jgi:thiol:disulfide interchange protein DsbD
MNKTAITLLGLLFTSFIFAQDIITWNFSLEDAGNGELIS